MKNVNITDALNAYIARSEALSIRNNSANHDQFEKAADDINANNEIIKSVRAKLEKYIAEAEGKARVRRFDFDMILEKISHYMMISPVSKTALSGSSFTIGVDNGKFPNAYNGTPECTWTTVTVSNGKFYISNIRRYDARHKNSVVLSESAKTALVRSYSDI